MTSKAVRAKEWLAKCPVCGGEAEKVVFGVGGKGVWVGCCRTEECSRYVEYHKEGWGMEDAVADWNRRNSGVYGAIRRIKRWFRDNLGEVAAEKKREQREKKEKKEAREREIREMLGEDGNK